MEVAILSSSNIRMKARTCSSCCSIVRTNVIFLDSFSCVVVLVVDDVIAGVGGGSVLAFIG
jgi:hypothetical protein